MAPTLNPLDLLDDANRRRLEERFAACGNSHKPFHASIEECALDIIRTSARDVRSLRLPVHVWPESKAPRLAQAPKPSTTTGTDTNR